MKSIKDYIKSYKKPEKWGLWTFEEFCDINNLNESDITDDDINYFYTNRYKFLPDHINGSYIEWVNESLTSHSREKLINKLTKILGEYCIGIIDVKMLFGAGCTQSILYPMEEERSGGTHCFIGMTDPSARKCLDKDLLAFSMPFSRFLALENEAENSFLTKATWQKISARI